MAGTIHVVPAEGLKVRDPLLRDFLPAEGRDVDDSDYWRRRIRDCDVRLRLAEPQKELLPKTSPRERRIRES